MGVPTEFLWFLQAGRCQFQRWCDIVGDSITEAV